jgi:hypothetical protein
MSDQKKKSRKISKKIIVAIIGAIALIISALIASPLILRVFPGNSDATEKTMVRIADSNGKSISKAKVLAFYHDDSEMQYSDSNGVASFMLPKSGDLRVIVETDHYEIHEQEIKLPRRKPIDVRLKELQGSDASVIFRVVDDATSAPIPGAKVLLLVNGDVISQITDSNGITKYNLAFPEANKVDTQMTVNTEDYEIVDQLVTLTPNKVQDVRLDPVNKTLQLAEVTITNQLSTQSQQELTSPNPGYNPNLKGVSVDVLESTLVDTTKGFSVSTEPAPSEKNTGELKILLAYPNNQPISGKTVDIYTQKMDLNNQPVRGERVKRLRTDDTGILTTELEAWVAPQNTVVMNTTYQ